MQTSRFIIVIELALLCLTAFFTYNLHHQFVTGLNPYIGAVAISLFLILIGVNAYIIFKITSTYLKIIFSCLLILATIVPPIINALATHRDASMGIPRRYISTDTFNNFIRKHISPYDSLLTAAVDTLTLQGKRKYLLNQVLYDNRPNDIDYDTLIDLNYDGNEDYMIGYRNAWIEVFLLNPSTNSYIEDEKLSRLKQPSFFLDKRKITSFVSLNSGESGKQLEWIDDDWKVTKEISEMDSGRWEISFPLKGTSKIVYSDGPLSSSHLLEIDDKWK